MLESSELWAVVKADGYGHGAADVGRAALEGGATMLCVATVAEGVALRSALREARILVLGPTADNDVALAREASLELTATDERVPEGVPVHLKLDTGMGRWGLGELEAPGRSVVGVMTHLATSESDPGFAREQLERFRSATEPYAAHYVRHAANSAAALTLPETRLDAARCGIALYGIDPFGVDAARFELRPALRWESELGQVKRLLPGRVDRLRPPVRRDGGDVDRDRAGRLRGRLPSRPDGDRGRRRRVEGPVVGTVSMDAVAVRLPQELDRGTPVTLVGDGVSLEEHARVADTIGYELACGIRSAPGRGEREVRDG